MQQLQLSIAPEYNNIFIQHYYSLYACIIPVQQLQLSIAPEYNNIFIQHCYSLYACIIAFACMCLQKIAQKLCNPEHAMHSITADAAEPGKYCGVGAISIIQSLGPYTCSVAV